MRHETIALTNHDHDALTEIARESGMSLLMYLERLANAAVPNRERDSHRGRQDTVAVKIARLHAERFDDTEIAAALQMSALQVGIKRRALGLRARTHNRNRKRRTP